MFEKTAIVLALLMGVLTVHAQGAGQDPPEYKAELAEVREDVRLSGRIDALESALATTNPGASSNQYAVRSRHFIFGMPLLTDARYSEDGEGTGVSLVIREPFVVGYSDALRCPIWVAQRWTKDERTEDQNLFKSVDRDWLEDPDLPASTHIGVSYSGNATALDRGHMAKHSMNRAWGYDGSIYGCLMSNSVPQHKNVNRNNGGWYRLEEEVEQVVASTKGPAIVWTISGALFRDTANPDGEPPAADIKRASRITGGFAVPYATYKVVAWFDEGGAFHARGYVFEQPYERPGQNETLRAGHFDVPRQSDAEDYPLSSYIRPIDEIEGRAGIDLFPALKDSRETLIEKARYGSLWKDDSE